MFSCKVSGASTRHSSSLCRKLARLLTGTIQLRRLQRSKIPSCEMLSETASHLFASPEPKEAREARNSGAMRTDLTLIGLFVYFKQIVIPSIH